MSCDQAQHSCHINSSWFVHIYFFIFPAGYGILKLNPLGSDKAGWKEEKSLFFQLEAVLLAQKTGTLPRLAERSDHLYESHGNRQKSKRQTLLY